MHAIYVRIVFVFLKLSFLSLCLLSTSDVLCSGCALGFSELPSYSHQVSIFVYHSRFVLVNYTQCIWELGFLFFTFSFVHHFNLVFVLHFVFFFSFENNFCFLSHPDSVC